MVKQSALRPRRRLSLTAAMAAATLAALAACGSSSSGGSSPLTSSSGGSGSSASEVAAARADIASYSNPVSSYPAVTPVSGASALRGKTVWYVPIGASVPILTSFGDSMTQALANLGVKVRVCDGKFLPTAIASCFDQAATQGADAVVGGYVDYKLVPAAYDNLVAHRIPVLVAGVAPEAGKTNSKEFSFYNQQPESNLAGKLMAEGVIADSNAHAHVLYIGDTDTTALVQATAYVKNFFEQHCGACTFTVANYETANISKLPSIVSAALISHPETTYVLPGVDIAAAGSLSGIQTAGFTNKVKLASTTASLDSMQRLKSGGTPQFLDVGASGTYQGWLFADGIVEQLTGHVPVAGLGVVRVFTHDNVGNLSLSPAAYSTNAWYGSDGYMQTFRHAWGLS